MFVDASAIVAIMTEEPGSDVLISALDAAAAPLTSAVALYEAAHALSRKRAQSLAVSRDQLRRFTAIARIEVVGIAEAESDAALDASARFGKGSGHPARLNMGDCFAYACARTHDAPLLFVGEDFSRTDIRAAMGR
jgi:ribonuclease VapC